jgi:Calcineurin-like phosphoesterase superfamily domain
VSEPPTLAEYERREGPTPDATIKAVADLLHRAGVDPAEVGSVDKVRLSEYQTAVKDDQGDAQVIDLKATSVLLTPAWDAGPKYPVVTAAQPVRVTFRGNVRKATPATDGLSRAVILPDPQIGHRIDYDGNYEPFHDEAALDAAVALCRTVRPDRIVCLGDLLDLPAAGKYRQEPSFGIATQRSIDRAHEWLAALAKIAPVDVLEGNHDARLSNMIRDHAMAAYGLKRAKTPDSWPALSVPALLRIGGGPDDLDGVNYVGGYPVGAVWLAPNLVCIHGQKLKLGQVLEDSPSTCVVQGHTHKASFVYKQRRSFDGPALMWAASPGCLCRTDGAVPGVNAALDERTGRSLTRSQDWHQGMAVVTYAEDGSTMPHYEFVPVDNGVARWRDHTVGGTT